LKLSETDLKLISGEFLENKLPPDKLWLAKYFRSKQFVIYCVEFNELLYKSTTHNFGKLCVDHTGSRFSTAQLYRNIDKFKGLENALKEAEEKKDFELIAKIKFGKYILA
jgi:hypothetical protein